MQLGRIKQWRPSGLRGVELDTWENLLFPITQILRMLKLHTKMAFWLSRLPRRRYKRIRNLRLSPFPSLEIEDQVDLHIPACCTCLCSVVNFDVLMKRLRRKFVQFWKIFCGFLFVVLLLLFSPTKLCESNYFDKKINVPCNNNLLLHILQRI